MKTLTIKVFVMTVSAISSFTYRHKLEVMVTVAFFCHFRVELLILSRREFYNFPETAIVDFHQERRKQILIENRVPPTFPVWAGFVFPQRKQNNTSREDFFAFFVVQVVRKVVN